MSNFRQKLKKLFESSFNENRKIDNVYQKKSSKMIKTLIQKLCFIILQIYLFQKKIKQKIIVLLIV